MDNGLADAFQLGKMYKHMSGNEYECVHIRHGDSLPYHFQSTGKKLHTVVVDDYGKDFNGTLKIKGGKVDKPNRKIRIDAEVIEKICDRLDRLEAHVNTARAPDFSHAGLGGRTSSQHQSPESLF